VRYILSDLGADGGDAGPAMPLPNNVSRLAIFVFLALLGALASSSTMAVAALQPMLSARFNMDGLDVMPFCLEGQPGNSAPPHWPLLG